MKTEMIQLLNLNQNVGNTRMAREKYEIYRHAILESVPANDKGIPYQQLPDAVRARLPKDRMKELGKVTWHVTSVKLDLEARGLIERIPNTKPQFLRRCT